MITRTNLAVAILIAAAAVCVEAQKANGPVPRLNGKPDLSGVWQSERTSIGELRKVVPPEQIAVQPDFDDINKYMINVFWDINPKDWPLNAEGAKLTQQQQRTGRDFQSAYCLPGSLPAAIMIMDFKMIQTPKEIVVISGNGDPARQIHTDGRSLPKDPNPAWMGSSVGRWDGDTLVVETTGFTEKARLDAFGHPRSETMRLTERYHRRDAGHMDLEITIDDAKYYTRPFSIRTTLTRMPTDDVPEYVCTENEKDNAHFR